MPTNQGPSRRDLRPGAPTFDRRKVLAHLGGDRSLLQEIVEIFRQDAPKLLETLRHAIEAQDGRALSHSAHALKGAVSNFAAERAFELARQLESMGERRDFAAATKTCQRLADELALLEEELDAFLAAGS